MKKKLLLLGLALVGMAETAVAGGNVAAQRKSDAVYQSVRTQYTQGKISADSVVSLAIYHKAWSPETAEKCLGLVKSGSPKAMAELGALYALSPKYASRKAEGVRLLESAAKLGNKDADAYLGEYYFYKGDYKQAKSYLEAAGAMKQGVGYAAMAGMYADGHGYRKDPVKAREFYLQSALKGYPRGASLYGFNLLKNRGGGIDYPDAFFWLYIAGDLGDDAARTALYLPRRGEQFGDGETNFNSQLTLRFIEASHKGHSIKEDPVYKDGFVPSLKEREAAAEKGDDWARYYLGSMNYNDDFLNQNYARAIYYYEPISKNAKLPATVLAVVNERLAKMYADGKGTKVDKAKAAHYNRLAAKNGSIAAYKIVENIPD